MDIFLKHAKIIGKKICDDAIWYKSKCNWVASFAYVDEYDENNVTDISVANSTLDPYVYSGTSGIAYFLSFLYKITKDNDFRDACIGAINHAESKIQNSDPINDSGFYVGKIGVIYSMVQAGLNLNNASLVRRGYTLLQKLKFSYNLSLETLDGSSGSIPALISLFHYFKDEKILNLAKFMGDEILDKKVQEAVGWSWKTDGPQLIHNLTGLAHGASGIGHGLLELYFETEDKKYLEGANNAFAYEDYWYDKTNKNWPDFRDEYKTKGPVTSEYGFSVGWCNGAPGIGLTRIRAYEILKNKIYLKHAKNSLHTTKSVIRENLYNNYDYSLCHGLSGLCDILLYSQRITTNQEYRKLAIQIGMSGIKQFSNFSWPCGVINEQPPGLMLGLSGIGYFFLRLYDNTVPSILLINSPKSVE